MQETIIGVTRGTSRGQQKRIEVSNVAAGAFAGYRTRELNMTGGDDLQWFGPTTPPGAITSNADGAKKHHAPQT